MSHKGKQKYKKKIINFTIQNDEIYLATNSEQKQYLSTIPWVHRCEGVHIHAIKNYLLQFLQERKFKDVGQLRFQTQLNVRSLYSQVKIEEKPVSGYSS